MATEQRGEVTWRGDLVTGRGTVESVGSGAFGPLAVSWPARTPGFRSTSNVSPSGAYRRAPSPPPSP